MRTTLTLDDDVARRLQEIAHRRRVPFKEAVNATLRLGLARVEGPEEERPPFRVETFASPFRPGVDPARLNQLLDELEARERFEDPVR